MTCRECLDLLNPARGERELQTLLGLVADALEDRSHDLHPLARLAAGNLFWARVFVAELRWAVRAEESTEEVPF